jgi:hypothetical protein
MPAKQVIDGSGMYNFFNLNRLLRVQKSSSEFIQRFAAQGYLQCRQHPATKQA